jgi:hypothetical protein
MGLFSRTPAAPPQPDIVIRGKVARIHADFLRSFTSGDGDWISVNKVATVVVLLLEGHPEPITFVDAHGTRYALTEKGDDVQLTVGPDLSFKAFFNHSLGY